MNKGSCAVTPAGLLRARFLGPLVKARAFGMTPGLQTLIDLKIRNLDQNVNLAPNWNWRGVFTLLVMALNG